MFMCTSVVDVAKFSKLKNSKLKPRIQDYTNMKQTTQLRMSYSILKTKKPKSQVKRKPFLQQEKCHPKKRVGAIKMKLRIAKGSSLEMQNPLPVNFLQSSHTMERKSHHQKPRQNICS